MTTASVTRRSARRRSAARGHTPCVRDERRDGRALSRGMRSPPAVALGPPAVARPRPAPSRGPAEPAHTPPRTHAAIAAWGPSAAGPPRHAPEGASLHGERVSRSLRHRGRCPAPLRGEGGRRVRCRASQGRFCRRFPRSGLAVRAHAVGAKLPERSLLSTGGRVNRGAARAAVVMMATVCGQAPRSDPNSGDGGTSPLGDAIKSGGDTPGSDVGGLTGCSTPIAGSGLTAAPRCPCPTGAPVRLPMATPRVLPVRAVRGRW